MVVILELTGNHDPRYWVPCSPSRITLCKPQPGCTKSTMSDEEWQRFCKKVNDALGSLASDVHKKARKRYWIWFWILTVFFVIGWVILLVAQNVVWLGVTFIILTLLATCYQFCFAAFCCGIGSVLPTPKHTVEGYITAMWAQAWAEVAIICENTSKQFPNLSFTLKSDEEIEDITSYVTSSGFVETHIRKRTYYFIEVDAAAPDIENQLTNALLNAGVSAAHYEDQPIKPTKTKTENDSGSDKSTDNESSGSGSSKLSLSAQLRSLEEAKEFLSEEEYSEKRKKILESIAQ